MARVTKHGTPAERVMKVLNAGTACFGRKGFYEATLDDVIRKSGLSRGSFYWHFESKDALYDAVIEHCATHIVRALNTSAETLTRNEPLIPNFLRAVVRDLRRHEDEYRVLYWAPKSARGAERVKELTALFVEYVRGVVSEAVRRGEIEADDAETLSDVVYALAEGMIIRNLLDPSFNASRYIERVSELLHTRKRRSRR